MSWNLEYVYGEKGSYKALCNAEHEEIANVSLLNDEFIKKLIEEHNKEISDAFERGIYKGIDIEKSK